MSVHEKYMRRCLDLASLAAGRVSPNPMVGAVIVHNDKIIGEGYHERYGGPHAEVNAVANVINAFGGEAETLLRQATLYVSLEPCAHHGKTPPCTDLIIRHKIPQVVAGVRDPFIQVDGKGIEKLRSAGVDVITGMLEDKCRELNKRFFTSVQKQRPYIILKWAQTANGLFSPADGSKRWISDNLSRKLVHKWRAEEDAVLVGTNTALADDPVLNVREWSGTDPVRLVVDRDLKLPPALNLFHGTQKTIVFNRHRTAAKNNVTYIAFDNFDQYLPQQIAYQLYLMDIRSVLIEGGAQLLGSFIEAGLWDEARIFTGKEGWDEGVKAPDIRERAAAIVASGNDSLSVFYHPGAIQPNL